MERTDTTGDVGEPPDLDALSDIEELPDTKTDTDSEFEGDIWSESDGVVEVCAEGLTRCGGVCVDTDQEFAHCGGCNEPCGQGPAGGSQCIEGVCELVIDYATSTQTHTSCTEAGGEVVSISGDEQGTEVCRFDTAHCPNDWNEAAHWTTTVAQFGRNWSQPAVLEDTYECNGHVVSYSGAEADSGSVVSGEHAWANRDPAEHTVECITWEARLGNDWCTAGCWDSPGCDSNSFVDTHYWQSCDSGYTTHSEACGQAVSSSIRGATEKLCSTGEPLRLMGVWRDSQGNESYRRARRGLTREYSAAAQIIERGCW